MYVSQYKGLPSFLLWLKLNVIISCMRLSGRKGIYKGTQGRFKVLPIAVLLV